MSWRTTSFFQSRSFARVDLRRAERDAVRGHLVRFFDHPRGVQQRLRRNAADVQADAAERRPALDERDLEPEVGGAERGGVAARPGADHDEPRPRKRGAAAEALGPLPGAAACAAALARRADVAGRAVAGTRDARWLCAARRRLRGRAAVSAALRPPRASGSRSPAADLVAHLDRDGHDFAGLRRRHVHRRLVGLERDQRVFGATRSPGFTSTSMTSTSLKSPRSGTRTSTSLTAPCSRNRLDELRRRPRGSRRAAS